MQQEKIIHLIKRKDKMSADRGTWQHHWQDVANFVMPNQADFVTKRSKGDKRTNYIYDSIGVHSNEMLAAGIHGFLTNPSSEWFSLRLKDDDDEYNNNEEVKNWLDDTTNVILSELSSPDVAFSSHMHEYYLSLTGIGTSVLFIGEPSRREGIMFKPIHVNEVFIAENSDGIIDTVYRCFKMSIRQIVQKFGEESLSNRMRQTYEKKEYDKEFDILHCVYPRDDVKKGKKAAKELPVASVYIDEKEQHVIKEGGFNEMPYMVGRWSKAVGETFGRSPAMTALPDIKMLQEMMKTTLRAAQKIVDPSLLVDDDGVMGPIRTTPGSLIYRRKGANIDPLITGANIPISFDMMEDIRNRVRTTFYLDQLQFTGGPQMTATEVMERTERTMRLLGPTLGRLQSEFLGPMIERIYGILSRAGRLPAPPEIIAEQPLKIEYVSPLARAQKQMDLQGLMRTIELAGPIAGVDPEAAQVIKGADTVRYIAELNGVPPRLMKSDEDLQAERDAQARMMQAQQAMATMQQGMDIAKTAKEADISNV